jgi:sugar O-acyltransferase (sialic acid O-acetyltransferase NeuD family)
MKNLIIIGAGGMGRTLYDMAHESIGYGTEFIIKGFLDDDLFVLDNFDNYPPILGTIDSYIPEKNDIFVCSMGGDVKKKCISKIIDKQGDFINLIHQTARIGSNVIIGKGNIIGAYTSIGADAKIGDYNMIQSFTVIGHDAVIGNWSRIDTHVTCVGGVRIENEVTIHTSAVLNHKVVVENNACIGACSFVIKGVKTGTTVMGNPAKILI